MAAGGLIREKNVVGWLPKVIVMASTSAKPPTPGPEHPKGRPNSDVGMTQPEARELRARLTSFAREWDDPRMHVYDDQT
jgi:hypothetical protein